MLAHAHAVPNCIALRSHAARTVRGVSTTLDHRWFHEQPICEQLRALCHPSWTAHRQHETLYSTAALCCLLVGMHELKERQIELLLIEEDVVVMEAHLLADIVQVNCPEQA